MLLKKKKRNKEMRADLTVYFEPRNMFLRMDKVTEAYKVLIVAHD